MEYFYLLSQPDELIKEQCKQMGTRDLATFLRTNKRVYNICREILVQRKQQIEVDLVAELGFLLEEDLTSAEQRWLRRMDKLDALIVGIFALPLSHARRYFGEYFLQAEQEDYPWRDNIKIAIDILREVANQIGNKDINPEFSNEEAADFLTDYGITRNDARQRLDELHSMIRYLRKNVIPIKNKEERIQALQELEI